MSHIICYFVALLPLYTLTREATNNIVAADGTMFLGVFHPPRSTTLHQHLDPRKD